MPRRRRPSTHEQASLISDLRRRAEAATQIGAETSSEWKKMRRIELIPLYKYELPDDVMNGKVWKPGDIIAMISEIDPGVFHDRKDANPEDVARIGRPKAASEE